MNMPAPLFASLLVALGGAIGSLLRYQAGRLMTHLLGPAVVTAFPWATLTVNLLGSVAMGLLAGWLARFGQGGEHWRLFIGVGVLGGFTTFSAFSLEMALLLQRGQSVAAFLYITASVLLGLLALTAGMLVMRAAG
jgi:CrcB protein